MDVRCRFSTGGCGGRSVDPRADAAGRRAEAIWSSLNLGSAGTSAGGAPLASGVTSEERPRAPRSLLLLLLVFPPGVEEGLLEEELEEVVDFEDLDDLETDLSGESSPAVTCSGSSAVADVSLPGG